MNKTVIAIAILAGVGVYLATRKPATASQGTGTANNGNTLPPAATNPIVPAGTPTSATVTLQASGQKETFYPKDRVIFGQKEYIINYFISNTEAELIGIAPDTSRFSAYVPYLTKA